MRLNATFSIVLAALLSGCSQENDPIGAQTPAEQLSLLGRIAARAKKMRAEDGGSGHRDSEECFRAQQTLVRLGVKAIPQLLESLKGEEDIRRASIFILWKLADPAAISLIAAALNDADPRVRSGTVEALESSTSPFPQDRDPRVFAKPVVQALAGALADTSAQVRWSAARALNRKEASSAEGALAAALAKDTDKQVRAAAARAIGTIGSRSPAALEALRAAAQEGPFPVRKAAGEALKALAEVTPPVTDPIAKLRERMEKEGSIEEKKAPYSEITHAPGGSPIVIFVLANGASNVSEFPDTTTMVARMIQTLPPESSFGVVLYSQVVTKYPSDGRLARAEGQAKLGGLEFVRDAELSHGSWPHLGFEAALAMLDAATERKATIVYAGNGFENEIDFSMEESLEEISRRNGGRAAIHTFAGGEKINAPFLKLLAGMNGGTFTHLNH